MLLAVALGSLAVAFKAPTLLTARPSFVRADARMQQGKMIAVGDTIPNVEVETEDGELKMLGDVLGPGLSVLVGMPGAFTPTCTDLHLPSYYSAADDFAAFGCKSINVLTLNDKWVNAAWLKSADECIFNGEEEASPITMLADPRGDLLEAIGMIAYLGREMGIRSKRFAMLVENDVVKYVAVDEGSIAFEESASLGRGPRPSRPLAPDSSS